MANAKQRTRARTRVEKLRFKLDGELSTYSCFEPFGHLLLELAREEGVLPLDIEAKVEDAQSPTEAMRNYAKIVVGQPEDMPVLNEGEIRNRAVRKLAKVQCSNRTQRALRLPSSALLSVIPSIVERARKELQEDQRDIEQAISHERRKADQQHMVDVERAEVRHWNANLDELLSTLLDHCQKQPSKGKTHAHTPDVDPLIPNPVPKYDQDSGDWIDVEDVMKLYSKAGLSQTIAAMRTSRSRSRRKVDRVDAQYRVYYWLPGDKDKANQSPKYYKPSVTAHIERKKPEWKSKSKK